MISLDTSNVHLLLVEDNPRYLDELKEWLDIFGYQHIETARDADQAREKLDEKPFDVIVADMRLEGDAAGGFAVLSEVKTRNITSVVIVLTANDTVADCRRAFKEDAWDYIPKSIQGNVFEKLDESIREAMTYFNLRGSHKDKEWLEENMAQLYQDYAGQYIAVINKTVIEAAESEEVLKERLSEKRYPVFLPIIKKIDHPIKPPHSAKLTIYVEGPTDVAYIKKAATMLGQEMLLEGIDLEPIGNETGTRGNGSKALAQAFNYLQNKPKLRPNKILFLCDQDVRDSQLPNKGHDFENLLVRRIDNYSAEQKGIEWLLPNSIFEKGFEKDWIEKNLGRVTIHNPTPKPTYVITQKMKFCHWICNERDNTPQDFEGFQKIFQIISEVLDKESS